MNTNALDQKCPTCTAPLHFNPKGQNWHCDYCGNDYSLEEIKDYAKKMNKELNNKKNNKIEVDSYTCSNCGAKIVADPNTSATFCVYCKNTAILKDKLQDQFAPSLIIPFYNTKDDAVTAFKQLKKGRPFMPKAFSDEKNISEMRGIYIPFWLYDCAVDCSIETDSKRVHSWSDSRYNYVKTDSYKSYRSGNMEFEKIPVDGSTRFDDKIMNSIEPFDYKKMVEFNYSYLSGFLSEIYDVDSDKAYEIAIERAKKSAVQELKNDIKGYSSVTVLNQQHRVNLQNKEYALLPVWLLNIKYKDKMYTFAMNGQTGKLIGNIPIDKKKVFIMWISIFLGLQLIGSIILLIGGAL